MREIRFNVDDTDTVALLYYAFKRSGRLDTIFYGGHDLLWFLDQFKQRATMLAIKDNSMMGFAILNQSLVGNRGEISFGFLPECSPFDARWFANAWIDGVFNHTTVDYLYGTTPASNTLAWRLAKIAGMREVARIPNYCDFNGKIEDAVMTYVSREERNQRIKNEGNPRKAT